MPDKSPVLVLAKPFALNPETISDSIPRVILLASSRFIAPEENIFPYISVEEVSLSDFNLFIDDRLTLRP